MGEATGPPTSKKYRKYGKLIGEGHTIKCAVGMADHGRECFCGADAVKPTDIHGPIAHENNDQAFIDNLINAHWAYVRGVIEHEHGASDVRREMIEYHYRTAMKHGFKHGVEYAKERK